VKDIKIDLSGTLVGDNERPYIIAEIGQNHNGDINTAKELIDMAKRCGANAVKFQKRDMDYELTKEAFDSPYENNNSFGKTYGEHRIALELDFEEHKLLMEYAKSKRLTYFLTPCDMSSVDLAEKLNVPFYKVASRDLTNIPLIERIANTNKPVIISTGMASIEDIDDAVKTINKQHNRIIIMQCTSQYPADIENINLGVIKTLRQKYNLLVGLSDHNSGIICAITATFLGACIIEKHITISRSMKGSDHAGSLEEKGLSKLVDYIDSSIKAIGSSKKEILPEVLSAKKKLGRSLTSSRRISIGTTLTEEMLVLKSPGDGIIWRDRDSVVGKKAKKDIEKDCSIKIEDFS